jgi:hypothetical protein
MEDTLTPKTERIMKGKWWIIVLIVLILIIAIGYFDNWQTLSIVGAAIIAPFKVIWDRISGSQTINDIERQHQEVRVQEAAYQQRVAQAVEMRKARIGLIDRELEVIDSRIELLEDKRKHLKTQVEGMSLDEKADRFREAFGD